MVGIHKTMSWLKLALMLTTCVWVLGADSALVSDGQFYRVTVEPGHVMTSLRQSRSLHDCAATCLSARCSQQPCCTGFCQSLTSSACYLNMTSESTEQPLPDGSLGFKCYVREIPACLLNVGYLQVRGECVTVYNESKPYGEALSQCEEDGGHLYYYKNWATDQPVITDLLHITMTSSAEFWVGADMLTSADFQWHDGSPLPDDDPIWYGNEPTRGGEYCVGLDTSSMHLNDLTCANENYFICQIDV